MPSQRHQQQRKRSFAVPYTHLLAANVSYCLLEWSSPSQKRTILHALILANCSGLLPGTGHPECSLDGLLPWAGNFESSYINH